MSVKRTKDFKRIQQLPRRDWHDVAEHFAIRLTEELKTPQGTQTLKPIQGQALYEIGQMQGGFLPIGVGEGKSYISALAATVLNAKKPVLFVPASLRSQTFDQVLLPLKKHWRINKNLLVQCYSDLSIKHRADAIFMRGHDVWIFDESHHLKNLNSGRTKRIAQHFAKNPDVKVVAMSGTMANRSIMEYWHTLLWSLKEQSPIPLDKTEAMNWADAIDEKKPWMRRVEPSALIELDKKPDPQHDKLTAARTAFSKRLAQSPGVIVSLDNKGCNASIVINTIHLTPPSEIKDLMDQVANEWVDPQGGILFQASEVWRTLRELGMGFYYKWKYPGPPDWMEARKVYSRYVRERLQYQPLKYQTPGDVWEYQESLEENEQAKEFVNWVEIRDTFKPIQQSHWISDHVIDYCSSWLKKHKQICWVEHIAFGERLARASGCRYFGGDDDDHRDVLTARGPIICSIQAHGVGKNFQDRYDRNLVTSSPTKGETYEQLIGRTHRHGQKSDEIIFDQLLPNETHANCFIQAQRDAKWVELNSGAKQKLNVANIIDSSEV